MTLWCFSPQDINIIYSQKQNICAVPLINKKRLTFDFVSYTVHEMVYIILFHHVLEKCWWCR